MHDSGSQNWAVMNKLRFGMEVTVSKYNNQNLYPIQ